MKKIIAIVLILIIILPCNIALAAEGFMPDEDFVTKEEAVQFAEELKDMDEESYDISCRLIVSSSKQIDYLDAIDIATGIDDLYVLQFDNESSAKKAEEYYNSLSYVNYVEQDYKSEESAICALASGYTPQCFSTVNSDIDDAIKFANELQGGEMPEIKVGIMDTGISKYGLSRVIGGYSFIDGSDNIYDGDGHGTKVTGVVLLNTPDNVKIIGYKVLTSEGYGVLTSSEYAASFYMAVADGCRVVNCSYGIGYSKVIEEAVNYAYEHGCIVVGAAGNDSLNVEVAGRGYPGKYDNSICVGATSEPDRIADFSNFGDKVDIYAAGKGIRYKTAVGVTSAFSGTSASSPIVTSICAILLSANPDFTSQEIKDAIKATGRSTNEKNMNQKTRTIADAYEALKYLTGKQLPQVSLSYEISKNEDSDGVSITFKTDSNATIYYVLGSGGDLYIPYYEDPVQSKYNTKFKCRNGDTINFNDTRNFTLTVCAYAYGKAKSRIEHLQLPIYNYESGYLMKEANDTQAYNIISRCQITDEKVIEVPETVDGFEVQEIGKYCFMGNQAVETIILPETVKEIDQYAFYNCQNLKTVIAPGVECCGMYAFADCTNLTNVEMPNVTVANTAMFKSCTNLETAKLGTLTEIDNHAFYGCENLKLVKTTADDISFAVNTFKDCNDLTVYTPKNSSMETFALDNNIALLGDVIANGGSIRVTDAGLRFGYQYNGKENKNIEEYGFVYSSGKNDDLTVDNAIKLVANNRINHGEYTTYNLVFINIPYTNKAFNQMISAKAYIEIGGEYFYSEVIQHSYNTVANAVLNDETIDEATKKAVQNILRRVV